MVWDSGLVSFFCMSLSGFPSTIYWRDYPIFIVWVLLLCHKLSICVWVYFWAFSSLPLIYKSVFLPLPYCCDYYSLLYYLKIFLMPFFILIHLSILLAISLLRLGTAANSRKSKITGLNPGRSFPLMAMKCRFVLSRVISAASWSSGTQAFLNIVASPSFNTYSRAAQTAFWDHSEVTG